ncbi:MAG: response regulator [Lachnospiraceae bacterium]|nr:response regulator [Lachnospiraceae bacterium]
MGLKEALKKMRTELKVIQGDFAAAIHVSCATVSHWENGHNAPNRATAVAIMDFAKDHHASQECLDMLKEALFQKAQKDRVLDLNHADYYMINQMLNCSANGVYVCDYETYDILYINQSAAKMVGSPISEAAGKKCYEYLQHRKSPCPNCTMTDSDKEKFSELEFTSPNTGKEYFVRGKQIDWYGKPAQIEYMTEATASHAGRLGLQKMAEGLPCGVGIYRVYPDDRVELVYLNDGYYTLLHSTREERAAYRGFHIFDAVHDVDRQPLVDALKKAIQEQDTADIDVRILNGENQYQWFNIKAKVAYRSSLWTAMYLAYSDIDEEKKAQLQLEESYRAMELVASQGDLSLWMYDLDTKEIVQNFYTSTALGYPMVLPNGPETIIAMGGVHEEDVEQYLQMYQHIIDGDDESECTARIYNQKAEKFEWQHLTLRRATSLDREQNKVIGFCINVDLQMEAQMRYERELHLRQDLMEDTLSYFRMNLTTRLVEEIHSKSFDTSKLTIPVSIDELLEKGLMDDIYEDDREFIQQALNFDNMMKKYQAGRTSESFLYRRYISGKGLRWVRGSVVKIKRVSSDDIIAFYTTKDVDDERKDELAMRSIVREEIESVLLFKPKERKIRYILGGLNSEGMDAGTEKIVDKRFRHNQLKNIVLEDVAQCLDFANVETIEDRLKEHSVLQCKYRIMAEDGSIKRKKVRAFYLDDSRQEIVFAQRDITDLYNETQRQQEQLQKAADDAEAANKAKTDFLSRMSHDMRTPLNGILNFANFIQEAETLEEVKELGEKIRVSGEYLQTLINDTLGMSHIESGKVVLKREPYIYSEFEPSIRNVLEEKAREKGVELRFVPPRLTEQYVMFDKLRLQQIFVNLLNNAIKFTPAGGIVQLETELCNQTEKHETVRFTVSDTGIGMSEKFLKEGLFKPFVQEHPGQDNEETGTGLGVAIVKQLVEIMGGTITCKSRLGEGTTFVVEIPVDTVANYEKKQNKADAFDKSVLQGHHILLCEDHPLNREIALRLLKDVGCTADIAENGKKGVEMFAESECHGYDLILMDIRMPEMDGLTATRKIREMSREDAKTVPIIAMTANAFAEDVEESKSAGMNEHLSKPISPAVFYQCLAQFL